MFEGVKIEKKSVETMKDDDELEMLLGEIPHATSSLNLHPTLGDAHHHHHQHNNLVDHGYVHASCVTQKMNGHVHGMYGDELLKHKYACASSPVSGFSLQSDGSSSSLFSGGGRSLSDIGSPSPPQFEELKTQLISGNGFWLDSNKENGSNVFDDFNLPRNFSKMYISDEREGVPVFQNGVQSCDRSPNGAIRLNFEKYGASDNYRKCFSDYGGFNLSVPRGPMNFEGEVGSALVEMQHDPRIVNLSRSRSSPGRFDGLLSRSDFGNSGLSPQFCRGNLLANNNFPMGFALSDVSSTLNRPSVGDSFFYASRNGVNLVETRDACCPPNVVQLAHLIPHYNEEDLLHYGPPPLLNGRNKVPLHVRVPQGSVEAFAREDSLIIQGENINYGMNRGHTRSRGQNTKGLHHDSGAGKPQEKRSQLDSRLHVAAVQDGCRSPKMLFPFSLPSKCSSLAEAQGYIYHIAKDQHGCRFLQRMFDEGTSQDVQIIFNEIIDHVVELMMNPFGNYLMQKLLEVCNEEQRMHILLRVTQEPGELVRISLNTHGTRVVQKLVETLKIRQQISLVISALEPGFLALIKDLNGNHVVQRCLQCFTTEDSKFIFVAAAKYCVDIATHQHGCCVLQRCITHSTGELRENLVAEISANGLLLAQDAYGNYVVQFILDLKIPSATAKLTSQFEGNYVHLSTQKFSSHVVEKCLVVCNDEARSKVINELLSATYFEQLLQDPHANYVVQTALRVSEGPLHNALVNAIESYKAISRNSPYSKRIFSHKLLKR
ncbi:putative pumilio7, chloroplastic [Sesamum alatum]|uniref:Pumilio7, chloroplastic n=1 Tax=Sesamum alatum TaxID=300844 RepID=A0AAE1YYM9_9LAMI|nr:putative pumilio7, chloroplastic [Sesamum alatum]